jgi:hypothetical protein
MPYQRILPVAVSVLELGAGAVYFWRGNYRLAIVWICVGIANAAFAGIE